MFPEHIPGNLLVVAKRGTAFQSYLELLYHGWRCGGGGRGNYYHNAPVTQNIVMAKSDTA